MIYWKLIILLFSFSIVKCGNLGNSIIRDSAKMKHTMFFTDSERERQAYLEKTGQNEVIEWFGQFADDYEPNWFEQIWMLYNDAILFPFWIPQLLIYGDTPRRSYDSDTGFFKKVKEKKEPMGKKILRSPSRLSHYTTLAYDASALLIPNFFYYNFYDQTIFGSLRKLRKNKTNFSSFQDATEIQEEYTQEEFQDFLQNSGFDPEDFDESSAEKIGLDEEDYQILLQKGYFSAIVDDQSNVKSTGEIRK